MKSQRTKDLSTRLFFLRLIDVVLLVTPVLVYFFKALFADGLAYQKVALMGMLVIALVLTGVNILFKFHLKSPIWVILIGIYIALKNILPLIVLLAVSICLDELVFVPFIKKTKTQLVANKEIDLRTE